MVYNPYQVNEEFDPNMKRAQAVYLHLKNYSIPEIAKWVLWSERYFKSFLNYWSTWPAYSAEILEEMFEAVAEKPARRKAVWHNEERVEWGEVVIEWLNGSRNRDSKEGDKSYLFRFYEGDEEVPVFSKIGTTSRECFGRLKDEIRYYNKHGFEIERVEICAIWRCDDAPAESYESFLRAMMIKHFPNTWRKNDRFFGVSIPVDLFKKMCEQYAGL